MNGVDVNQRNENGATPLYVACRNGHVKVVRVLLEADDVDVNQSAQDGKTPLGRACDLRHLYVVKALLNVDRIDVNQPCQHGYTPLYLASGNVEITKALLAADNIDPNKRAGNGLAPIDRACARGHIACVAALYEHGAAISARNWDNLNRFVYKQNPTNTVADIAGTIALCVLTLGIAALVGLCQLLWRHRSEHTQIKHRNFLFMSFYDSKLTVEGDNNLMGDAVPARASP